MNNILGVASVLIVTALLHPVTANADPGRCDGAQCVPGVATITTFPPDTCTPPHGAHYVFGVLPGKENTYSFVCSPGGRWGLAPVLIGVRFPGDPCPTLGTYSKGPAAQSPDGLPMLCDDSHHFAVYTDF